MKNTPLPEALVAIECRSDVVVLAKNVVSNRYHVEELLMHLCDEKQRVRRMAAWTIGHLLELQRAILTPFQNKLVEVSLESSDDAVLRGTVKALSLQKLKQKHFSSLFDRCLELIANPDTGVAVKAWSTDVLVQIVSKFPELGQEVKLVLEPQLIGSTPGWKSKIKKAIQKISTFEA